MRKLVLGMLMVLVGLALSGLGGCGQDCCMEEIAQLSHDIGVDGVSGQPDKALAEMDKPSEQSLNGVEQEDLSRMQERGGIAAIPGADELEADITAEMAKGCDLDGPLPVAEAPASEVASRDSQMSILEAVAESEHTLTILNEDKKSATASAQSSEDSVPVPGIAMGDLEAGSGTDVKVPESASVAVAVVAGQENSESIMTLAPGENETEVEDNLVNDVPEMSKISELFNSPAADNTAVEAQESVADEEVELAETIDTPVVDEGLAEELPELPEVVDAATEETDTAKNADESWQQTMLEFDEGLNDLQLDERAPVVADPADTEAAKVEAGEMPLEEARADAAAEEGETAAKKDGADVSEEGVVETEESVKTLEEVAVSEDQKLLDNAQKAQDQENQQLSGDSEKTSEIDNVIKMEKIRREARLAEASNLVKQGKEMYEARQYTDALKAFEQALKVDPEVADAREMLDRTRTLLGKSGDGGDAALLREITRTNAARLDERSMSINNNLEQASSFYLKAVSPDADRSSMTRVEQIKAGLNDLDSAQLKAQQANTLLQGSGLPMEMEKTISLRIKALMAQISSSRKSMIEEQEMIDRAEAQRKVKEASTKVNQERTNQITALFVAANGHKDRYNFDKAQEIVEQILRLDPNNERAQKLKEAIQAEAHVYADKVTATELDNAENMWNLDVEESYIMPRKALIYPLDWERVKARSRMRKAGDVGDFEKRKLLDKLTQIKAPIEYADLPLNLVLNDFRNRAGVNIMLDKDVDGEKTISITLRGVNWLVGFEQILAANDLQYRVHNQAIEVFEKGSAGSSEYTLRIYQVADLVNPMKNYKAPDMVTSGEDEFGDDDDDDDDEDSWKTEPVNLPEQVRNFVPGNWDSDMASVELWEDNLLVRQTPEVHAKLLGYLDKLRESAKLQVLVEGRFMDITKTFLEAIGFDWSSAYAASNETNNQKVQTGATFNASSSLGSDYYYGNNDYNNNPILGGMTTNIGQLWSHSPVNYLLNSLSLNLAFNASQKTEKGSVLHNPKVLVANGRNAYAQVVIIEPYMVRYTISGVNLVPEMQDVYQGVTWEARPIVSFDRKYITVRVRPQIQDINDDYADDAVRTAAVVLTDGDGGTYVYPNVVTINPVTRIIQFETNATVPDGGTVLIGGMLRDQSSDSMTGIPVISSIPKIGRLFRTRSSSSDGSNRVVMVSAKIVDLDD